MPDIDYAFDMLATAASDVHARVGQIIEAVDSLAADVNAARSTWQSTTASGAYSELQRFWNQSELEVRDALTRFGQAVGQSGEEMHLTERSNTSVLST
jgi:WXG100 family type VII secretion target